ncbi:MAG TPA: sigma-54 dependent transcriptional regulator [Steroidobacteraceae bacterium]|nr:sigma-54 dependent transcriptional regulator [Steroidobacteraceae bacterium]
MKRENGRILIVDDDAEVLLAAEMVLKRQFPTVVTACTPASIEMLLAQQSFDVILLDMNFTAGATSGEEGIHWLRVAHRLAPDSKVVLMTAYGGVDEAVNAMRAGAADFVVKPWDNAKLVATVSAVAHLARADREVKQLRGQQRALNDVHARWADRIVGEAGGMRQVLADIDKVARTDANVLITGENGTGKELVARAIHRQSLRDGHAFVGVDLGAITETLFESELFGHRKGAFTDAREDRAGRFEAASGGTLFLDEIGNLSLAMQAKLLGALETMTVTRVGSDRPLRVDARVICATNLSPEQLRTPERFRPDLLYRINTIEIRIPPLRERREDIPLLVSHYAQYYARKYGRQELSVPADTMTRLQNYRWPGNVRELKHAVERAVIMSDSGSFPIDNMVLPAAATAASAAFASTLNLDELEKLAIERALAQFQGNLTRAAQALGLGRTTLYRKMARHGLQ